MGLRLLIPLIVILLVVWLVRQAIRRRRTPPTTTRTGTMLRCDHCGLHIPEDEAVFSGDTPYCSDAHRDAAAGD